MTETVLAPPSATVIRGEHEQLMLAELLGPAGGEDEEVVEDRVTERYILGMLAPQGELSRPEEQDALPVEGEAPTEEGEHEPEAPSIPTIFPSSCGLTFAVDGDATVVAVTAGWGRYVRERSRVETEEGEPPLVWRRYSMAGNAIAVDIREGELDPLAPDQDQPEVRIRGRARRHDGEWLVTLFLVNGQEIPKQRRDEAWLFQVELAVEDPEGGPIFRRRPEIELGLTGDEQETRSLAMLYRDNVEFAVGHAVSVHAVLDSEDPRRAVRIETRGVPVYEVPLTEAPTLEEVPELDGVVLDMKALVELPDSGLLAALSPLAAAYEAWIVRQEERIADPNARLEGFEDTAREALRRCRLAAERIRAGVSLVVDDPDAREAFRFANRAMWLQRVRSLAAQDRRRDPSLKLEDAVATRDLPQNRTWRPFQLAFVLMNLPALANPTHEERAGGGARSR
jgi:hypothetical protein